MARRFNRRTTQLHDVKYLGWPKITLHIILDNLELARRGDEGMQRFIIKQYLSQLEGVDPSVYVEWNKLSLQPVGIPMPPTPEVKKPNTHLPGGAVKPKPETYGCTCERDECASCDQGWHQSCRYNCKHGQVVR